jgi:hypothetical protein
MTAYDESVLLRKLSTVLESKKASAMSASDRARVARLHRKLRVRALQRSRLGRAFDFDSVVADIVKSKDDHAEEASRVTKSTVLAVLDRYVRKIEVEHVIRKSIITRTMNLSKR